MTVKTSASQEILSASDSVTEDKLEANTAANVISVRNVSKIYPLYAKPSDRLKQSLWYALPQFLRGKPRQFYREFWALRDISFEMKKGETVGIIGRNGSGKSTLLQIIAGTLAPTQGEVEVNGRVAALLELGSGFNAEFTGRENVYLNGAILGLTQADVDQLFDDIAAFADIGQFIDQPVKLYSSGMFVRLAFAVQVFVPKEIFIVDEALSVGDEAFRRKCTAALEKFRDDGGTVLLVSHDAQMIVRQCERCLLLHQGQLLADDASKPVTDLYYKLMFSNLQQSNELLAILRRDGLESALFHAQAENGARLKDEELQVTERKWERVEYKSGDWFDPNMPKTNEVTYGNGDAEIFEYGMYNEQGHQVNILVTGNTYQWRYKVKFHTAVHKVNFGFLIKTVDGIDVAGVNNDLEQQPIDFIPAHAIVEIIFELKLNLAPAMYFLNMGVSSSAASAELFYLQRRVDVCSVRVISPDHRKTAGFAYLEPSFTYRLLSVK
jgi:lipopolysaccharide transport system ATP-binding protein